MLGTSVVIVAVVNTCNNPSILSPPDIEYSAPIWFHVCTVDTQRIPNFYVMIERRPHILIDVGIDDTAIDRHSLDIAARDKRPRVFLAYRFLRLQFVNDTVLTLGGSPANGLDETG